MILKQVIAFLVCILVISSQAGDMHDGGEGYCFLPRYGASMEDSSYLFFFLFEKGGKKKRVRFRVRYTKAADRINFLSLEIDNKKGVPIAARSDRELNEIRNILKAASVSKAFKYYQLAWSYFKSVGHKCLEKKRITALQRKPEVRSKLAADSSVVRDALTEIEFELKLVHMMTDYAYMHKFSSEALVLLDGISIEDKSKNTSTQDDG